MMKEYALLRRNDDLLRRIKFDETRDMMGQLAREMTLFTTCVHRSYPKQSEYHTLQLLLEIIPRPDQEGDDEGDRTTRHIRKNDEA